MLGSKSNYGFLNYLKYALQQFTQFSCTYDFFSKCFGHLNPVLATTHFLLFHTQIIFRIRTLEPFQPWSSIPAVPSVLLLGNPFTYQHSVPTRLFPTNPTLLSACSRYSTYLLLPPANKHTLASTQKSNLSDSISLKLSFSSPSLYKTSYSSCFLNPLICFHKTVGRCVGEEVGSHTFKEVFLTPSSQSFQTTP